MTLDINKKDQEPNPFEESFSAVSSKFKTYESPTMSYYNQDVYSTVSDQRTVSEDSDDHYYYNPSQYPYPNNLLPQQSQFGNTMNYDQDYQPQRPYNKSKPNSSKKRNRSTKLPQDEEKRKNFLERNRLAALKCRQRKKQWLVNLQARVEFLTNDNDQLQMESDALRKEIMELKTLLLAHKDCPQYIDALKTSANFMNPSPALYHHSMHLNNTTTII